MAHLAFALSVAAALASPQPQATDSTGRVTGRVVVAGSTTPVAGAQVTLSPIRRGPAMPSPAPMPPGPPPQRVTGEDGRFTFERMLPGEYRVSVSKAGFAPDLPAFLFGNPPAPPKPPVTIVAGQALDLGDLTLERGGAIAGRVLDANGEPLADAHVSALRRVQRGRGAPPNAPELLPIGQSVQTNDLGEFRVFGLPSGDYIVAATPRMMGLAGQTTATAVPTTTYFPGTPDSTAATPVNVTAGGTTNGIEIRLATVPAFRVTGVVVDAAGNGVAGAFVTLLPSGRVGLIGGPAGSSRTGQNGGFTISGVPAGTYRAHASVPEVRHPGAAPGAVLGGVTGGVVFGSTGGGVTNGPPDTEVVVTDRNVAGVRIVIQAR